MQTRDDWLDAIHKNASTIATLPIALLGDTHFMCECLRHNSSICYYLFSNESDWPPTPDAAERAACVRTLFHTAEWLHAMLRYENGMFIQHFTTEQWALVTSIPLLERRLRGTEYYEPLADLWLRLPISLRENPNIALAAMRKYHPVLWQLPHTLGNAGFIAQAVAQNQWVWDNLRFHQGEDVRQGFAKVCTPDMQGARPVLAAFVSHWPENAAYQHGLTAENYALLLRDRDPALSLWADCHCPPSIRAKVPTDAWARARTHWERCVDVVVRDCLFMYSPAQFQNLTWPSNLNLHLNLNLSRDLNRDLLRLEPRLEPRPEQRLEPRLEPRPAET